MFLSSPPEGARRFAALHFLALAALLMCAACRSSETTDANEARGIVVVNSPASGEVRRVLVNEGTEVVEGTPVAEIAVALSVAPAPSPGESADARAARSVRAAQAEIDAARAEVVKQEGEVLRLTPLVASGEVPQAQLDAARDQYERAQQRLRRAQDASRQADNDLIVARQPGQQTQPAPPAAPQEQIVLALAPKAGTVAVLTARVGTRVQNGQPLATIRTK